VLHLLHLLELRHLGHLLLLDALLGEELLLLGEVVLLQPVLRGNLLLQRRQRVRPGLRVHQLLLLLVLVLLLLLLVVVHGMQILFARTVQERIHKMRPEAAEDPPNANAMLLDSLLDMEHQPRGDRHYHLDPEADTAVLTDENWRCAFPSFPAKLSLPPVPVAVSFPLFPLPCPPLLALSPSLPLYFADEELTILCFRCA
jgi:hypothetical protein